MASESIVRFSPGHSRWFSVLRLLILALPLAGVSPSLEAQIQDAKLLASDAEPGDVFGGAVSLDGDVALVGARGNDIACPTNTLCNSGSAYIYRRVNGDWGEEVILTASDMAEGDRFGLSVALHGDVAVVGAPQDDDYGPNTGSAYVFRFDGVNWIEEQKLLPGVALPGQWYGWAVDVDQDVIVVSAPFDDAACPADPDCNSGAAYVYRFDASTSTWVEEAYLVGSDAAFNDQAGYDVAVHDDVVLVGSLLDDDACLPAQDPDCNSGAVYVYRLVDPAMGTWAEEAKLVANDADVGDWFGLAVTVEADVIVVGTPRDDEFGLETGAAYVFRKNGPSWSQEQKLLPVNAVWGGDFFGWDVSLHGNTLVVTAPWDDDACPGNQDCNSGSAYVFVWDGSAWVYETELTANDGFETDEFGVQASVHGDTVLVGSLRDDDACLPAIDIDCNSGSAYTFTLFQTEFRRGDANVDGSYDIGDAIFTLGFLFSGGELPSCEDSADANDDGRLDISDAIHTLTALFSGGDLPPLPHAACGPDPTQDLLQCAEFGPCP